MSDETPEMKRPRTRGECPSGPCPWVGCRYHLLRPKGGEEFLFSPQKGFGKRTLAGASPPFETADALVARWEWMKETCALHYADNIEHPGLDNEGTLEQIAQIFGLSRERIRQIEERALEKLTRTQAGRNWLRDMIEGPGLEAWAGAPKIATINEDAPRQRLNDMYRLPILTFAEEVERTLAVTTSRLAELRRQAEEIIARLRQQLQSDEE